MEVDQNNSNNLLNLKKAYAEIILNTSKEAAARVMVSERRAGRLQYELIVAKQEAIQMMIRFKLLMDSKISEAEMTSRSQQGKIEELEAQLQEAEDIVKDLREELRYMQEKLERTSNNKAQYLDKQVTAAILEETCVESLHDTSRSIHPLLKSQYDSFGASDMKAALNSDQWIEDPKCCNQLIHVRNSYCVKPNLPSIILRSKGNELYRNGRTQRIRACERNLFNDELFLTRQPNGVHHERKIKGGEEDESIRPGSTDEVDTMCSIQKKEAMLEDSNLNSWYQVQLRKKDGTTRSVKTRSPPCKQLSDQDSKIDEAPDTSPKMSKSDQLKKIHTNVDPNLSTDMIHKGQHPKYVETTKGHAKEFDVEVKSTKALIDIESVGDEDGSTSFICQVSKTNLDRVDEPIAFFMSKASNITDEISQPVTPNVIKHTFQRKQKTELLNSSDGSISLERRTVKRKREGKQNDPDNSCFV